MKKLFLLISAVALIAMVSCGGEAKKDAATKAKTEVSASCGGCESACKKDSTACKEKCSGDCGKCEAACEKNEKSCEAKQGCEKACQK